MSSRFETVSQPGYRPISNPRPDQLYQVVAQFSRSGSQHLYEPHQETLA